MTVASLRGRQLRIEIPLRGAPGIAAITGVVQHPLPDGVDVCAVIRRLAPIVPVPATWSVRQPVTAVRMDGPTDNPPQEAP